MKIKSLIIDDNQFTIDMLTDLLQQNHSNVEIVGFAKSGLEGLEKIDNHQPDLVFLDIELPENGIPPSITFKSICCKNFGTNLGI